MTMRRLTAAGSIFLVLHLHACTSWTPSSLRPRSAITDQEPSRARVILNDGETILVEEPRIRNDSIVSVSEACRTSVAAGGRTVCQEVWTPVASLDDVHGIDVEKTEPIANLAMAALVVAGLFALLVVVACAGEDDGGIGSPCG